MESLIFGSTAARFWFPDFRTPKDIDKLTLAPAKMERGDQEYYFGESTEYILEYNIHEEYVDPQFLFTIKAAHFKWGHIFWEKTANDIVFFQKKGLTIHERLYKLLMKDFTKLHGRRWASLEGKDSTTFFEDAVKRKYVHDTIHDAVAYYDKPLYESILKGDGTVGCSEAKFNLLSLQDQLKLVKEEVFVTALERFMVPEDFKFSSQRAYWLSLKKLITTMSAGWFSKFIIAHYSELAINKDDYVKKFKENSHKLKLC